jgi:hypothetical protein
MTLDEFAAMKEKHVASGGEWRDVEPPHFYDDAAGRPRVEVVFAAADRTVRIFTGVCGTKT